MKSFPPCFSIYHACAKRCGYGPKGQFSIFHIIKQLQKRRKTWHLHIYTSIQNTVFWMDPVRSKSWRRGQRSLAWTAWPSRTMALCTASSIFTARQGKWESSRSSAARCMWHRAPALTGRIQMARTAITIWSFLRRTIPATTT